MSRKLKDHVVEGNQLQLKKKLDKSVKKIKFLNRWIDKNIPRDNKAPALSKLLLSVGDFLEVTKHSLNMHVSVLALSARNQYELNIRIRTILEIDTELDKWCSEALTDMAQTLEAFLQLDTENENLNGRNIIHNEIRRLDGLKNKHNLPDIKRPESTGQLAKLIGQEEEHKTLFKIITKLVHPSSYLVNDYTNASSSENHKILQIHAQLYAHDSVVRICGHFEIPDEICKPYIQA
jgi:hypothetical protein